MTYEKEKKSKQENLITTFKEQHPGVKLPGVLPYAHFNPQNIAKDMINIGEFSEDLFFLFFNIFLISLGLPIVTSELKGFNIERNISRVEFFEDEVKNCWKIVKTNKDGVKRKYFKFCQRKKNLFIVYDTDKQLKNDPLKEIENFRKKMMVDIAIDKEVNFKASSQSLHIQAQNWAELRGLTEEKQIVIIQKLFLFLKDVLDVENQTGMSGTHITQTLDQVSKAGTFLNN